MVALWRAGLRLVIVIEKAIARVCRGDHSREGRCLDAVDRPRQRRDDGVGERHCGDGGEQRGNGEKRHCARCLQQAPARNRRFIRHR